jgi:NADH-quinone oxidoreductase subunit G
MTMENTEKRSDLVNLTIDGKPVSVPAGTSVIQAAKGVGVSIPHFCWHPGLPVAGVCRLCMVKIEGNPKLQIGCNTTVAEGMKVETRNEEAKQAQKWALEFHLVNHPLDCPTCDQAGECKLQDYYMSVGRYDSQVQESKVLKPKALEVGRELVLDTERCILCSRCVRFEDSVTKTSSLGIFNRGDHSTIGTIPGRTIEHNYSYNLVDICPVGAFTSKDFRFRCRVWFLEKQKTVCPGCATGCSVSVHWNKKTREYFRLKPECDADVNGYWMCDYGRHIYNHCNADTRAAMPSAKGVKVEWNRVVGELVKLVSENAGKKLALVLTPQYTNEEYAKILGVLKATEIFPSVFIWRPAEENSADFDGILFRGDRNPNTFGMNKALADAGITASVLKGGFDALLGDKPDMVIVLGPELEKAYPDFCDRISDLAIAENVVYFGMGMRPGIEKFALFIPVKVFAEKGGTYLNYEGRVRQLHGNPPVHFGVQGVDEIFATLLQRLKA